VPGIWKRTLLPWMTQRRVDAEKRGRKLARKNKGTQNK